MPARSTERAKPKRNPLRKITAKKVKPPKDVPVGPKQVRYLRSLGHNLNPVVHVGKAGVTEALAAATVTQLLAHELIKVKLPEEDRDVRQQMAEALAVRTGAVLAQVLGRTALLYKRHPKNPKIALPRAGATDPASAPKSPAPRTLAAVDDGDDRDDEGVDDEESFDDE